MSFLMGAATFTSSHVLSCDSGRGGVAHNALTLSAALRAPSGLASFPGRKIRPGLHCFAHARYSQKNLGISARLNIFRLPFQ